MRPIQGSGLSANFNLPTWRKLTEDVISEIDDDKFNDLLPVLKSGILTPIEVLDKIQSEHSKVRSYIKENFSINKDKDFLLHKKIMEVTGAIITTNYDNAFEEACSNTIIPTKYTSNFNISEINKSGKPYIFKLHGCFTEPDNCIIFSDDYRKLYDGGTSSKEKLKSIFIDKTILFIGFSFNDPDINLIFSSLDTLFDNHNRHYILTKEEKSFERYKFLKPCIIQNYETDIDAFFDNCVKFKETLEYSNLEIVKEKKKESPRIPRIAFLKPNPLDLSIDTDLSGVEDCLDSLNMDLFSGYLNTKTLESIDDYDILIIATKVFKSKLYVEAENLKSDLLTAEEICNLIPNDQIPIIFITNEKIDLVSNYNTINIFTFKRATIKRFAFKAFRNNDLNFNPNEEISVGLSKLTNLKFTKGSLKKSSIYFNDKVLDIGEKSLKNIVGRIEEQATIASKLQSIIRISRVLNIKASGGTGKTTLLKKVSYELYNRGYFKEGVSFKSCENVKSFADFEELLYIILPNFRTTTLIEFEPLN